MIMLYLEKGMETFNRCYFKKCFSKHLQMCLVSFYDMHTFLANDFFKRRERKEKVRRERRWRRGGEGSKEKRESFSLQNYTGIFPPWLSFISPPSV